PGRVDPHAPGPGNPQGDDGRGRFRACHLPQHDRRHRRPAPRHQALMLTQALLAGVELGLNRVLQMDSTALPRLARLAGKVIEVDCQSPALQLFILPSADGLQLARQWGQADCTLSAPASSLLRLAMARDKTAILHRPDVTLSGDSAALLELAGILQDLELDWEYELSRWLGPVGSTLLAGHLRSRVNWAGDS